MIQCLSKPSARFFRAKAMLDYPSLFHWFAQNKAAAHAKLSSIPIGLQNRLGEDDQRWKTLERILRC